MEEMKKPLVVVLTRNYSTGLSVIRSLGAAGYAVDMVASAYKEGKSAYAASSRYVRHSAEVVSKKVKEDGDQPLLDELLKYRGMYSQKPVLFPTDDYTASVMDLNKDKLEEIFIMPGIAGEGAGSLTAHMEKSLQAELARQAGLPVPEGWTISLREEEIAIPQDMIYPCFVKPMESISGYKSEMARCEDEHALKDHLKTLAEAFRNRDVLVQEFLTIENEIDLNGVCLGDEIIIPGIIRKTMVAQYEKGVTLAGEVHPFEELGALCGNIRDMMRRYGYVGMFDLELNVTADRIYFGEVNLRSGGPNFAYFRSGINLPALFVKHVTGEEIGEEEKVLDGYGRNFIYEKVAWDDYLNGYMTRAQLDAMYEEADIKLIQNEEDPAPEGVFLAARKEREQKKNHAIAMAAASGMTEAAAEEHVNAAKRRLGISYGDYEKLELWKLDEAAQEKAYAELLVKKEKRKELKEACIRSAMEQTGWNREEAQTKIADARERLGITYREYMKYDFCLIPERKQEKAYRKLKKKKI